MIEPDGQMPSADGVFFTAENPFNQGTFYTWEEEVAIAAMEEAESKAGQTNTEGVELRDKFTYEKTAGAILDCIYSN